jgi:predicted DNA-binding protein
VDAFFRSRNKSVQFGRMSQTSTERLRDYLAQLSPQSQALLMREFERAVERGEDTTVANFVLEQLRQIVRGTDESVRPRPGSCFIRLNPSWSTPMPHCGRDRFVARRCFQSGSGWSAKERRR